MPLVFTTVRTVSVHASFHSGVGRYSADDAGIQSTEPPAEQPALSCCARDAASTFLAPCILHPT